MPNPIQKIIDKLSKLEKKLRKGCGGYEEYWGHKCGIWITNTQGKNVHIFCNKCKGQLEIIKKVKKML